MTSLQEWDLRSASVITPDGNHRGAPASTRSALQNMWNRDIYFAMAFSVFVEALNLRARQRRGAL